MTMLKRLAGTAYLIAAFFASVNFSVVRADDTDIYISNPPEAPSAPIVMFSIDYKSNLASTTCTTADASCPQAEYFRTVGAQAGFEGIKTQIDAITAEGRKLYFFDVLRLSLHQVLIEISKKGGGIRVGLMMNHASDNNCAGPTATNCSNGGYILRGVKTLEAGDGNNAIKDFVNALYLMPIPQGNVGHVHQGKELYFELFRYLTGQGVYNGHLGYVDYGDNVSTTDLEDEYPRTDALGVAQPTLAWDLAIENNSTKKYISPLADGAANSCAKIFAINFMFQTTNQESDSDTAILATAADGGMAGINLSGKNNSFETVIEYMNDADLAPLIDGIQNVTSYFVVAESSLNNTTNGYAAAGGTTKALKMASDPAELVKTLTDIFNQILSVSTTFVAASVPVNVFNRAESLDNVFIALFQADKDGLPFWTGNLKKLKLGVTTANEGQSSVVELQDALGGPGIGGDGRIAHDALTYWTLPQYLSEPAAGTDEVALRDGRVVHRGAAGQKIPGFINEIGYSLGLANGLDATVEPASSGPRKVLYDVSEGTLLAPLNADDDTATALMGYFGKTQAESLDLIKWLRGINPATGEKRNWILGDPLHSRPLPINYGVRDSHSITNPLIYIAMASNDGYMHFFRNTNNTVDADGNPAESGKEVWAFVPTDVMGTIPKLAENTKLTSYPQHPYTVDGAPSVYLDDGGDGTISGSDKAYLYFGLRRGGYSYYALDVSDPNQPKLAWKISKGDTGFETLGQTWSRPQVGMMDYDADGTKDPVVVFGGGYDPGKDARGGAVGGSDDEGNAIYVVHATSGALIYKATHASMLDSIPSDVTIVDTNGDQLIDRIIVGDTGGNVWRVDTYGDLDNWQTTLLAKLGRHYVSDNANDRRFFHRPDFVQAQAYVDVETTVDGVTTTTQELQQFDAVLIGSGNRPNPLDQEYSTKPVNWLYMIRDDRLKPAKASPSPAYTVADLAITHGTLGDITNPTTGTPTTHGWKLLLDVGAGEKSLSSPLTLSNTVFFTTYLPKGTHADETDVVEDGVTKTATCGPDEGSGLLYAVDLATGKPKLNYSTNDDSDGENTSAEDRYKILDSAGIPADVVGINLDGQAYVLPPDLTPEKVDAATRWRTFWYEVEDSDL